VNTPRALLSLAIPAAVLAALGLGACSLGRLSREAPHPGGVVYEEEYAAGKLSADIQAESAEAAPAAPEAFLAAAPAPSEAPGQPPAEGRARIFSGYCRLVVDGTAQAKKELEELAVGSGGYVESARGATVVLRVPAGRFAEVFAAVQRLGETAHKVVETFDVADTLRDQEARLRLAESARERLYQLLERSSEVKERLAILREIKRLTEEIEQVRLSLELLKNQIAYSRITVELLPRQPEGEPERDRIPFPWIARLRPLYPSLQPAPGRFAPVLSDDFAVFAGEKGFRAEGPEGTRVRLGGPRHSPRGDEAFWQKALAHHLGRGYRKAEPLDSGDFRGVLYTSKDSKPYSYLVAVRVWRKQLLVLEAFFPDAAALEKRLEAVLAALTGLEVK